SQQLPGQFLKFHYEDKKSKLLAYSLKEKVKPAWFVGDYKIVPDREERFNTLNDPQFDVYQTAILEEEPGFEIFSPDSSSVEVLEASFNKVKYKIFNNKPALFVASEVYYPAADCWKCYIDEQEQDILKTNHILRSVFIETAGEHEVTFEFAPETFFKYYWLSMLGHLFVLICLLGLIGFSIIRKKRNLEK
ncbi:MAG: hypothetical protein H8E57_08405, partial [Candidatus Cloacimonetes bacterium]|nr:hypothetical protein [Candidatus Cloacimonadota bacterium]